MVEVTKTDMEKIRPYMLAGIPFLVLFAYELATVLPHRPSAPDLIHGYTIAMGNSHRPVYVSVGDLALILGPFFCAFAIQVMGVWRAGLFKRLLRG